MEISTKIHITIYCMMLALVGGSVFYSVLKQRSYEKQISSLQNSLAERDKTIELKDGLFHRLTVTSENLQDLLNTKDKYLKNLEDELKKKNQQLVTTTSVIVGLKKEIEQFKTATQTEVPATPSSEARTKVDFHNDFGVVKVDGWTMTNPPTSWVRLSPGKPLKLNISVAQSSDKVWHTYASVDDERFGIDINLTAVNPYMFKPKWYEGFALTVGVGAGTNQTGVGGLVQAGISYKVKQYMFGPTVWLGINDHVDKYYGLTFSWFPFEKTR